jgi:hypothetical protein
MGSSASKAEPPAPPAPPPPPPPPPTASPPSKMRASVQLREHKMSDLAEPPTIPMVILDLPQELIMHMLLRAPPSAIAAFVCCSSAAAALGRDNELWRVLLARVFPDVRPVEALQDSPMVDFISLACGVGLSRDRLKFCRRHCPCGDRGCSGDLLLADGSRCPCVCVRSGRRMPLRAGTLGRARSGTSCFRDGEYSGFKNLNQCMRTHFDFDDFEELEALDTASLAPLHLLLLCTTESPAPSASEVACLRAWVEAGGALITSAFSNWSAHHHFAQPAVGWLGVQTVPQEAFGARVSHRFEPFAKRDGPPGSSLGSGYNAADDDETARLTVRGPYGSVSMVPNTGDTPFRVPDEAFERGAVQLTRKYQQCNLLEQRRGTWLFWPPRPVESGGLTGRGRVLLCSNYHWLCDPSHWNGGFFVNDGKVWGGGDPKAFLLNFIAGALAARTGSASPSAAQTASKDDDDDDA